MVPNPSNWFCCVKFAPCGFSSLETLRIKIFRWVTVLTILIALATGYAMLGMLKGETEIQSTYWVRQEGTIALADVDDPAFNSTILSGDFDVLVYIGLNSATAFITAEGVETTYTTSFDDAACEEDYCVGCLDATASVFTLLFTALLGALVNIKNAWSRTKDPDNSMAKFLGSTVAIYSMVSGLSTLFSYQNLCVDSLPESWAVVPPNYPNATLDVDVDASIGPGWTSLVLAICCNAGYILSQMCVPAQRSHF